MSCLYMMTSPSNKSYIGITIHGFVSRRNTHIRLAGAGESNLIYRAIRKYSGAVTWKVLASGDYDKELLCLMEQEAISKYKTKAPSGYNMTDGGDGIEGFSHTDEFKSKMSSRMSGRVVSEETKARLSATTKGRSVTEKERDRLSKLQLGRKHSAETIEKMRAVKLGKPRAKHSEETKLALSIIKKAANIKKRLTGIPIISEETRAKMKETKAANFLLKKNKLP